MVLDQQAILERWNWLSFHHIWGLLGDEILQAVAASLHLLTVAPDTEIYRQDQTAIGLYVLTWGTVEIYRQSPVGRTHIRYRNAGDLFGYVPLVETAVATAAEATAKATLVRAKRLRRSPNRWKPRPRICRWLCCKRGPAPGKPF